MAKVSELERRLAAKRLEGGKDQGRLGQGKASGSQQERKELTVRQSDAIPRQDLENKEDMNVCVSICLHQSSMDDPRKTSRSSQNLDGETQECAQVAF